MERYAAETYGDRIAAVYDDQYSSRDPHAAVSFLAARAGAGPVLELGIGTGRVALPLAATTGLRVAGIDASERMVEQLRAKPGGDAIDVTIGDFADFTLGDRHSLVYVVFNTFFSLLTQDEQVHSFECVAAHLVPGGRFVIECFVPDLSRFDRGQRTGTTYVDLEEVRLDASMHEPARQIVRTQHVVLRGNGVQLFPVAIRYAWPAELDLMARVAGLELEARYKGWDGQPFDGEGEAVVTVYRKPDQPG